jgi:hypothetical protein
MSGRVVDSTIVRHDLTRPGTSAQLADSLNAEARALLVHLAAGSAAR